MILYSTYDYTICEACRLLPTTKQKSTHLCAAISSFPPRKHLGLAPPKPRKNRPFGRQNLGKFHFGGILCQSSNLFRAKLVSSAPTPVPAKLARVQPEKPPLESFLNFPPPYFFFLVERVGFSGSPPTASSGGVGALVGTADALRAKQRHGLITSCVYHRNHLLQAYLRNSVL